MLRYQQTSQRSQDLQSYLLIHRFGQDFDECLRAEAAPSAQDEPSPWWWNDVETLPAAMMAKNVQKLPRPPLIEAAAAEAARALALAAAESRAAQWREPAASEAYVPHREQWL
jgi:hypothetical protein